MRIRKVQTNPEITKLECSTLIQNKRKGNTTLSMCLFALSCSVKFCSGQNFLFLPKTRTSFEILANVARLFPRKWFRLHGMKSAERSQLHIIFVCVSITNIRSFFFFGGQNLTFSNNDRLGDQNDHRFVFHLARFVVQVKMMK